VKAFFYVQHLLGIGHLKRAAVLAGALERAGFEVTLASGGAPVAGIAALQLPPASSPDFRTLLDEHGNPVDDAWKARRREALLGAFRSSSPEVLLVELFPFGRRQMSFELIPLLEEAGSSLVVCSVRDILQPNPAREEETLARFARYFDRLLVHGDPRVATFERSFAGAARLAGKLHYTGYVVEEAQAVGEAGRDEVLVSAGGGAVGRRLLETAIQARALTSLGNRTWRVLAGVNANNIQSLGREGVIVEQARSDFTLRLRNCVVSVSQAGYNTVVETLRRAPGRWCCRRRRAEQTERARLIAGGLVQMVEERPATLAAAIDRAAARRGRDGAGRPDGGAAARQLVRGGCMMGEFEDEWRAPARRPSARFWAHHDVGRSGAGSCCACRRALACRSRSRWSRRRPSPSCSGCCTTASRCCSMAPTTATAPRPARRRPSTRRPSPTRRRSRASRTASAGCAPSRASASSRCSRRPGTACAMTC
jgi:predicted glycosyltransferase